ncbi:MAG TPA: translocation/assembly module TamB domain-containing protein [Caldimonas sp.]|nr:translocation/assembly module TamB domain-containing protein [Caldimonas sp.]
MASARRPRGARIAVAAGVLVLAAVVSAVALAAWALTTAGGAAWLLARMPGLHVDAPRGALLDDFGAARVELVVDAGVLRIDSLAWRAPRVGRGPPGTWLRVSFAELKAARVEWRSTPSAKGARPSSAPPTDLRLPFALDVAHAHIAEADFGTGDDDALRDLDAAVHLGGDDGASHRIERASARWGRLALAGSARIAAVPPFDVDARVEATQQAAAGSPDWRAQARAAGALAALHVDASVQAQAAAQRSAQRLDLSGDLRPFDTWPLGDVNVAMADFDVGALRSGLPTTRLTGSAQVRTEGLRQPASVRVQVVNAAPGRWNEARVPVRALEVTLAARPDDWRTLDVTALAAQLADDRSPAGSVSGKGRWSAEGWSLDAKLVDLQTQRLDGRAPPWGLGGTLSARSQGTDSIALQGALDGRIAEQGPLRQVALRFDATAAADRVTVRRADARVADAALSAEGHAERAASGDAWHAAGHVKVENFDPAAFGIVVAGGDASRLAADAHFDLEGAPARDASWIAVAHALRGTLDITLADSRLAGVGLSGHGSFRHVGNGPATAQAQLVVAGNRATLDGRIDMSGSADAWDAVLEAPDVAALAPLARAFAPRSPPGASGRATAEVHVRGRWPAIETHGRLEADDVRLSDLHVSKARASWQLDTRVTGALSLDAELTATSLAGRTVDSLRATLAGTPADHRLEVRATAHALPPAWVDTLQPPAPAQAPASATAATLVAHGAFVSTAAGPPSLLSATGWHGTVDTVDVRAQARDALPWLHAEGLALRTRWAGGPLQVAAQPGRIELLGSAVRWSRLEWSAPAPGSPFRAEIEADLDPLPAAPVLRRLQPEFGWGGDLAIGGHVSIHGSGAPRVDAVLERRGGDLTVSDEAGTQTLGLTDLRVAVDAADSAWSLTAAMAGQAIGAGTASLVMRVPPGGAWPSAQSPVEGLLELRVASLSAWSTWVPPGWRLGGSLHASAHVTGRLGAPDATGRITGESLSVRNFVEGVAVSDGELAIALEGTHARIERFEAHANEGTVMLEGDADLGEAPHARLHLRADRFQVLGRVDRRIVASGNADADLQPKRIGLEGRFAIDDGLVDLSHSSAPTLGDDVHVVRRRPTAAPAPGTPEAIVAQRAAAGPQAPSAAARTVALDVRVDMGQHLHVRGHGLDAELRGELHLTSPGGRLAVAGTVYTVDGTYEAYAQKLVIDRGQLVFSGDVANPRLDVEATRPNLDVRVGVAVTGTALNPRVRLFSEPNMTDMEKLSWLLLGRPSEGTADDTAIVQQAALALLAGEGGRGGGLTKPLGLDASLGQTTTGDTQSTTVTVGKQISQRWYLGYERSVNATTGSWQLIYRVARRLTVRAQAGTDESLDVIWTWRWQ